MFFSLPQHVKLKNEVIPSSHFEVKLNAAYKEGVSLFSLELQFTIQATGGSKNTVLLYSLISVKCFECTA